MANRSLSLPQTRAEFLLESLYAGVLGGSAVALFYLVYDLLNGQPLFTPSVVGQVLFQGVSAEQVTEVKLGAVAAFSVVHGLAFLAIGGILSFVVHEAELHLRHPLLGLLLLFVIIEAVFFMVAPLLFPGVTALGAQLRIGVANLLAAATMGLFFALSHRSKPWERLKHTRGELIQDSLFAGVLGGSVVALFFLFVDLMDGQPLFTPSLIGQVLFQDISAAEVTEVKFGAVVAFSVVHMLAFTALGAAISFLVHEVELHSRHPFAVLLVIFGILEVGFFVVTPLLLPDTVATLGAARVGAANLLAALTMALYLVLEHRSKPWTQLKHTRGELMQDSLFAGVLGGAAVALFFLFADLMDGRPLFTPSLIGQVLFQDISAAEVTEVKLGAIFAFSIVHIFAFTALGAAIAFLVHEVELHSRHPFVVLLVVFVILEVGFFVAAPLLLPGTVAALGAVRVGAANLLAAGTMALYFMVEHRAKAWSKLEHGAADLIFDSFYAGAIGGSVVALFFLITDALGGQPLFTPSLIGQVLFQGVPAQEAVTERLDAVAYVSILHFAAFVTLGAGLSFLVHKVELYLRHPFVMLVVLFAILEVSFFVVVPLTLPGVIERLGVPRVAGANLLAASAMAIFFVFSHREEAWEELKQTVHLT